MQARVARWKATISERVKGIAADSIKELKTIAGTVNESLVDLKPLLANLDDIESLDSFINAPGHTELVRSLKELQGVEGEGLKRYDRITGTLRCMDITWVSTCGKENFTECRNDLVRLQGKGRMQVA